MKKVMAIIIVTLFLASMLSIAVPIVKANPADLYVPSVYPTIQAAISAANPSDRIIVAGGTYVEIGQIVIGKDLTIIGESASTTIIKPSADTGSSGDARGWFLVQSGVTFYLSNVTLDGSGYKVWQGIRHKGQGDISNCVFINIKFEESGPSYAGTGIVAFGNPGNVNVTDCEFSEIGRVGVLYFGSGITDSMFSGNEYTGKGVGDWLDYAVEVGAGAYVTITGNTISNNLGVASVDGSTSAGVLVTTYYGSGSVAVITGNTISGCTDGIAVGYDEYDTSVVTAHCNKIFGNAMGISSTAPTVYAEYNWWGDASGPYHPTLNPSGLGDPVSDYVLFVPWKTTPGGFEIDIKPGSWPNSINRQAKGVVPVAVLSYAGFDATLVDPSTIVFLGASPARWSLEDIDGDGDLDLIVHFRTEDLDFAGLGIGEHIVPLTGTYLGFPFSGTDTIRIVK